MAAEIFDGSLQFTAGIDTSDTDQQIQQLQEQLAGIVKSASTANKTIVQMADAANSSFSTAGLEKYSTEVNNLFKSVQSYLQGTFGTEKLEALDSALNAVTNEGEQLKILLQFFKDNSDALDLNPQGAQQMLQNIKALEVAMEQLQGSSGVTVILPPETAQVLENVDAALEKIEQTAPDAGAAIKTGVLTPLGELDTLYLQLDAKATQLEEALSKEKNTNTFERLNKELADVLAEMDVVQGKIIQLNSAVARNVVTSSVRPGTIDINTASQEQLKNNLRELVQYASTLEQALKLAANPEQAEAYNAELTTTRTRIEEINAKFEETNQKQVRASAQLEQIRNQLANMSPNAEGYQALLDKAVELENRLKNVNKTVTLLGSNTAGIDALKQGFNGLVGGVSAVVSAYSLFTDSNDQLQQTMVKLFAVMQIVGGAEQFLATVNKNSAVVQYLLAQYRRLTATATAEEAAAATAAAGAEVAQAVATEGAAAAQTSLNAAMAANPIGALLIAITAVVGAISIYIANTESEIEIQTKLNEALANTNELLVQLAQLQSTSGQDRVKSAENMAALAQAEGKSNKEILDLKTKANNVTREEAIKQLSFLDVDKQRLGLMEAQLESINRQKSGIESIPEKDRTKEQKNQLENLEAQEKSIKSIYDYAVGIFRSLQEANAKQEELAAEAAKLARDNALKSTTAAIEARAIAAKRGTQQELLTQIDAINARRRQELADVNLTAGERVKINAQADRDILSIRNELRQRDLDDQISLAKTVLANAQDNTIEEFNARISVIQLEAQKQAEQDGVTAAKRKQIYAEANKEINELNRSFNLNLSQNDINKTTADINNRLAVVRKGSESEYELHKQLLNQQEALEISKANAQINNEKLLAEKLKEIHAKSIVDQQKLYNDYIKNDLAQKRALINQQAQEQFISLSKTINDPTTSQLNRLIAQRGSVGLEIDTTQKEINAVKSAILNSKGDVSNYIKQLNDLELKLKELNGDYDNLGKAIDDNKYQALSDSISKVSNSISGLANSLKDINPAIADIIGGLGQMVNAWVEVRDIMKKVKDDDFTTTQAVGTAIQSAVNLVSLLASAAAQRAAAEKAFNQGLIDQQHQYNLALNEAILLNAKLKDNVFLTDYQGQLKDGISALTDAQKEYQEAIKALAAGQAIAGKRNSISGSSILGGAASGAVIGAAIGSVVPVIGNVVGGVVGGVAGAIAGLFGGKKKKDTYVSLLQEYPELVQQTADGVLEINKNLAQTLIDNNLVSDSTKALIQDTLDWQAAIDKANEQIKSIISDLAGDLGSDLRDSLVDAFEQGTDSAVAFAQSVQRTLDNVLSQLIFNNVFGSAFDQLQKEMKDSFQQGGDFNWQDDLQDFFEQYGSLTSQFNEQLEQAQKAAEQVGLDIFQNPNAADSANTLKGAIKGITEQQADLLAGQFGGLRLTSIQQLQVATQNLGVLNQIKGDTAYLVSIESRLRKIETVGIKIIK